MNGTAIVDLKLHEGARNCTQCGECLYQCRYLSLSRTKAIQEVRRLRRGEPTPYIDKNCISCFSCEPVCPHDAHPYLAILDKHRQRYEQIGLPETILFMLSTKEDNFRKCTIRRLDKNNAEMVDSWFENDRNITTFDDVLYPGCNLMTFPGLLQTGILGDLPIAGSPDHCCGEMFFRLGLLDEAQQRAQVLAEHYQQKRIRRMIFACPACYHMFARVMPKFFGVQFDFEKIFITDWFVEQLRAGKLEIVKPLNREVQLHHSCHARVMGDEFLSKIIDFVDLLGGRATMTNGSPHHEGICCGVASAASDHSVIDILLAARRAMIEFSKSPSPPVAYCGGCALTFTLSGLAIPGAVSFEHLFHLASSAFGFGQLPSMNAVAWPAIRTILRDGTPLLLSRKRRPVPQPL